MTQKTRRYSDIDKQRAALAVLIEGHAEGAARQLGIPASTIKMWRGQEGWDDRIAAAREECDERLQSEYQGIIQASLGQLRDRITTGDYVIGKEGDLLRRPMSGKDLAVVNGIAFDKQRLLRSQPTSISSSSDDRIRRLLDHFGELGRQLIEKRQEKAIEGEVLRDE